MLIAEIRDIFLQIDGDIDKEEVRLLVACEQGELQTILELIKGIAVSPYRVVEKCTWS